MKSHFGVLCRVAIGSLILTCALSYEGLSTVQLSKIFANGMVLQRDKEIPVWGTASAGDTITLTFLGSNVLAVADTGGKWNAAIPAKAAGGPYMLVVLCKTQTIALSDVYVGDVWLASGQSNMEMQINAPIDSASALIAAANYPAIRQFKIPKALANDPISDLPAGSAWTPATSAYVGNFTAVGYIFAREIYQDQGIPIAIINSSYGGSRIETWMSKEMLGYDESDTVLASGQAERQPTLAFNAMINPIKRFPIKGIIWYQGESNADVMSDAVAYGGIFKTMIAGWRDLWGLGNIPFLWVQLPNYGEVFSTPQTWDVWPQLRAEQSSALVLPSTGEAVTIDVGSTDIHPTNKLPVGRRLALVARKVAYGEDLVYQGPRYKRNHLRADGKVEIEFDNVADSLVAKDSLNGGIGAFALAGSDNNLVWAQAAISNGKVVVWNNSVGDPLIVRYAWEYNPAHANLYNSAGLPTAPFLADVNPGFKITRFQAERSPIERGQSTSLAWRVFGASSITLDGGSVDSVGTVTVAPAATTTYTLLATNRENPGEMDTARVTIAVLDPDSVNRTLDRPATSSTYSAYSGDSLFARHAVDGNMTTRWSSAWHATDPQRDADPEDEWITVNFNDIIDLAKVVLFWHASYASEYNVDVSFDGYLWATAREIRDGNGGTDTIAFPGKPAGRFLRIHALKSSLGQGFSLYELAAYGHISTEAPPSVTVNTNLGNVLTPGATVTIAATTTDSDGKVIRTDFYVDGVFLSTDSMAPFEAAWTVDSSQGEHRIIAVATDDSLLSVQSAPLVIYVDNGSITRFEAEYALYTGTVTLVSLRGRSNGYYLQLKSGWVITFNNIGVPADGDYLLTFCYQLTYDSPKSQYLLVNGKLLGEVEFTAPSATAWLQKGVVVPLKAGQNEIAIDGYWEWMSLDYIGVRGATLVSVEPGKQLPTTFVLEQNYPNPFNPTTVVSCQSPVASRIRLVVYDVLGREVKVLMDEQKGPGTHTVTWDSRDCASGVYICRMTAGTYTESRKMMLLR
jgi:hypothetical protein